MMTIINKSKRNILLLIAAIPLFYSIQGYTYQSPEGVMVAINNPQTKDIKADDDFTMDDEDEIKVNDPFESFNRAIFTFNDTAYTNVMKPIAIGYRAVVPEKARSSIKNFFTNLLAPVRIVNAALQLKGQDATNELVRFGVNTIIGFAGFLDVARDDFNIKIKKEDFGQTLGHYGMGSGPYLVLPLWGPSSVRDGFGLLVDGIYLDPVAYLDETEDYLIVRFIDIETTISLDKDTYEAIKKDSLDPYIFIRNAYTQQRAGAVKK